MQKNVTIILDNGHGGIKAGKYVTAPNKMYEHPGGPTIYEGFFNREIVRKLIYRLKSMGIPCVQLVPGPEDMPLKHRVTIANEIAAKSSGKAIYISIHGNAGGGTGFEVFTSKGQTISDDIANYYMDAMSEIFPDKAARVDLTDGDKDKEANFYVLKNTTCPAILTENFFMDNLEDAKLMMSYEGQAKIVEAHVKTIEAALTKIDWIGPKPKVKAKAKPKAKPAPKKPVVKVKAEPTPEAPKIEPEKVDKTATKTPVPRRRKRTPKKAKK